MIEKMKVVHIVAAASEKTALLDRLRALGIVHFGEKASADQRHLERFAELSRMEMLLQEYTGQEPGTRPCRSKRPPSMRLRSGCPNGEPSPRRSCGRWGTRVWISTFTARTKRLRPPWRRTRMCV